MQDKLKELEQWERKKLWVINQHKRAMKLCQRLFGIPYIQHSIRFEPQFEDKAAEFIECPKKQALFEYSMEYMFDRGENGQYAHTEYDCFGEDPYIGDIDCADNWRVVALAIMAHEIAHAVREMYFDALVDRYGELKRVSEPVCWHDTYWQKCYAELREEMLLWIGVE